MVQLKELIICDLSRRGSGQHVSSPVRQVFEVYTKDGELLAVNDSQGNYSVEDMIAFGKACRDKMDSAVEEMVVGWKD